MSERETGLQKAAPAQASASAPAAKAPHSQGASGARGHRARQGCEALGAKD